jgi:hypothetical protein
VIAAEAVKLRLTASDEMDNASRSLDVVFIILTGLNCCYLSGLIYRKLTFYADIYLTMSQTPSIPFWAIFSQFSDMGEEGWG